MFACELKCEAEELINVYDMVSFCYDYLMDHVSNEANFIACYILENENTSVSNVNLKKLGHFQDDVCIFRKNRALAPHERSAVPLGTDHCPVG